MMEMVLVIAIKLIFYISLIFLGVWCCVLWKTRRIRHATRHLYTFRYKPMPFIGHLYYLIANTWDVSTGLIMGEIRNIAEKNIQTACIWLGPFPVVAVWGAEDVQKILTSTATNEKAGEYDYLKFASGNGLLTAPNNIWKITRGYVNPLFHPRNLEQLMPFFNQNCREMIEDLSSHVDNAPFNVYKYTKKVALKSTCHLIYGPDFAVDMNSQEFSRLLRIIGRVPGIMVQRIRKPWLWFESIFEYLYKQRLEELNSVLKIGIDNPVKESGNEAFEKQTKEKLKFEKSDPNYYPTDGICSLVEVYRTIKQKVQGFTDKDLTNEIFTLYITGTDSAGMTVASCLVALAQYPDIQEKLYDEIASVVDKDEITLEDIKKMQYLDQVYKETLRFTTIIPMLARKCTEDLKLSECTVPAGNSVVALLAGIHMNPKVYPNPKTFDPDRFSPENGINKGKNYFLPFSGGPRNCIGKTYAQILVKLMVVHILRHYGVSTDMDIHTMKKIWVVTLVSAEGYYIKLQKRHQN